MAEVPVSGRFVPSAPDFMNNSLNYIDFRHDSVVV